MKKYLCYFFHFCLIALAIISCDSFKEDNFLPVQSEDKATFVSARSAALIDLLENNSFGTGATITITQNPSQGSVKLISSGEVVYIPDETVAIGNDSFQYTITEGNQSSSGQVTVEIVRTPRDLPCELRVLADIVDTDPLSITRNPLPIYVVANDTFCTDSVSSSSLEIVTEPSYGRIVTSFSGRIYYLAENLPSNQDYDVLVYKVTTDENNQKPLQIGYAPVIINLAPCTVLPKSIDDTTFISSGSSGTIDVLRNDTFCTNTLDSSTFTIVQQPSHGSATINGSGFTTYFSNAGFSGYDTFTYRVCDNQANCTEATVHTYIYQPSCNSSVNDDNITISLSSANNIIDTLIRAEKDFLQLSGNETVIQLDVTANDSICAGNILIAHWLSNTLLGRVAVIRNEVIYIRNNNTSSTGTTSFFYSVRKGNSYRSARVSLEIRP